MPVSFKALGLLLEVVGKTGNTCKLNSSFIKTDALKGQKKYKSVGLM